MNVLGTLLAVILLLTGGPGSSASLSLSGVRLHGGPIALEVPLQAELAIETGEDEAYLNLNARYDGQTLPTAQARLTDEKASVAVDARRYDFSGRVLRYGSDLTELDAALLAAAANLGSLDMTPGDWAAALALPQDLTTAPWTRDVQGMGELCDGLSALMDDENRQALWAGINECRRAAAGDSTLPDLLGFEALLKELGFTEFRWEPAGQDADCVGVLHCALWLSEERWQDFRDRMERELRGDWETRMRCTLAGEGSLDVAREALARRVELAGIDATVETSPEGDALLVTAPASADWPLLRTLAANRGHLEFRDPTGLVVVEGKDIVEASVQYADDEMTQFGVAFQLNAEGTQAFAEATRNHLGQAISIYLDGELISAPIVQAAITGGRGIITGPRDATTEESYGWARRLALMISTNPLDLRIDGEEKLPTDIPLLDGGAPVESADGGVRATLPLKIISAGGKTWEAECPLDGLGLAGSGLWLRIDGAEGADFSLEVSLGNARKLSLRLSPTLTALSIGRDGAETPADTEGHQTTLHYDGDSAHSDLAFDLRLVDDGSGSIRARAGADWLGFSLEGQLDCRASASIARAMPEAPLDANAGTLSSWQALLEDLRQTYGSVLPLG